MKIKLQGHFIMTVNARGVWINEKVKVSLFFFRALRSLRASSSDLRRKKNLAGQETVGIILKRPSETMDGLGTP